MTDCAVVFLDVGQGDCTLALDRENAVAILVDCPAGRSHDAVGVLSQFGVGLSLIIASHSDLDHLGGIYEVVNAVGADEMRINLDSIVEAGDRAGRTKLRAAQRAIAGLADRGVSIEPCYRGDSGHSGDVEWRALSPTHPLLIQAQGKGDRNLASIIVRLEVGGVSVLVGGDAPAGAFANALASGESLKANVFRLSHHGGRIDQMGGPAIGELLDEIGAQHHIVSVGADNGYGHPTLETLMELGSRSDRARVLCTEVNTTCIGSGSLPLAEADTLPEVAKLGIGGRQGGCRCAGTVSIDVRDDGWVVEPSEDAHDRIIDVLDSPMCRPGHSEP